MFEFVKARRGRKAAVALIGPLVQLTSRGGALDIPERVWFSPYMVGFMGMLISLVAERTAGRLGTDSMGNVQIGAWSDITGGNPVLFGEEMCMLSAARNRDFEKGCGNAQNFLAALDNAGPPASPDPFAAHAGRPSGGYDPAVAAALWAEYVGPHVSDHGTPAH